jgi:hypothetical protein
VKPEKHRIQWNDWFYLLQVLINIHYSFYHMVQHNNYIRSVRVIVV